MGLFSNSGSGSFSGSSDLNYSTGPEPVSGGGTTAGGAWNGSAGNIIGGVVSGLAGIYDSYQSNKTARMNTDKTIAAQKAEAELAYQRSIEMWNMQNKYNSPQAQMERFKAAGLNPHLIYGQGNAGNNNSAPQYQPPNLQYRYAAPNYGAAINSVLPTIMQVGSWIQDMRLSQAELRSKQLNNEKAAEMINFMVAGNPKKLREMDNRLSLFPYQHDAQMYGRDIVHHKLFEMEQKFRNEYGEALFEDPAYSAWSGTKNLPAIGGTKRLEFLQKEAEMRLKQAQAAWTDLDITNPQALVQMALGGVLNAAGMALKPRMGKSKVTHELENRMSTGRVNIRRRVYEKR